jgi:hypothetical protein
LADDQGQVSGVISEDEYLSFVVPPLGAPLTPATPADWAIYVEATTREGFHAGAQSWLSRMGECKGVIFFHQIRPFVDATSISQVRRRSLCILATGVK